MPLLSTKLVLFISLSYLLLVVSMKSVRQVLPRPRKHWVGNGFNVFPVFADKAFTAELSPYLMFDYAAPKEFPADGVKRGVGQHPHRGFETVTIAFQGEIEHGDSVGNTGVIGPGDVQWMTAARGIVHEEFHSKEFSRRGGTLEMCQIWVNLKKEHKMLPPRYQPIMSDQIPVVPLVAWDANANEACPAPSDPSEGSVRVIAGEFNGKKGAALTWSQVDLWDVRIEKTGKDYLFSTVPGNNVIVFVRRGTVEVQERTIGPQDVAILHRDGGEVVLRAKDEQSQVLILAGEPIDEPISARGPFVMNTPEEIRQANADYRSGKLGR